MLDLVHALRGLGPREVRLLARAGLDGLDVAALGAEYGVSAASAGVLLARAARSLWHAQEGTSAPPLSDQEEAVQVAAFLRGEGPWAAVLARLREEREAVRSGLAVRQDAEAGSRRRKVENVVRWVAILAILAVAAWSMR